MIMPTKHISLQTSMLAFGGYVIETITNQMSVDEIWEKYLIDYNSGVVKFKHTFDILIETLVFLYTIGIIKENRGVIVRCN